MLHRQGILQPNQWLHTKRHNSRVSTRELCSFSLKPRKYQPYYSSDVYRIELLEQESPYLILKGNYGVYVVIILKKSVICGEAVNHWEQKKYHFGLSKIMSFDKDIMPLDKDIKAILLISYMNLSLKKVIYWRKNFNIAVFIDDTRNRCEID